jgi:hypothetical protein
MRVMTIEGNRSACYAAITPDGRHAEIGERKWFVGVILGIMFSPLVLYVLFDAAEIAVPLWSMWLILIAVYCGVLWSVGRYRHSVFDATANTFRLSEGFFVPIRKLSGPLSEIDLVRLYSAAGTGRSFDLLVLQSHGKEYRLAEGGAGATETMAQTLANIAGCRIDIQ